jgi:hypothetical protein
MRYIRRQLEEQVLQAVKGFPPWYWMGRAHLSRVRPKKIYLVENHPLSG